MKLSRSERFILFFQLRGICESLSHLSKGNNPALSNNIIDFLNVIIERNKSLVQGNYILEKLPVLKPDCCSSEAYLIFQTLYHTSQAFLTESEEKTILEKSAMWLNLAQQSKNLIK